MSEQRREQETLAEKYFAGIDIGGTKISVLITDENARILGRSKKKSKAEKGGEQVLERAAEMVDHACSEAGLSVDRLSAIGVGAPSPILPDGTAVQAAKMGWKNLPLTRLLEKKLKRPVFAENDCNIGTYGEYELGGHSSARTLIGLFVGTGLGGGLIKDGRMLPGENNMAAEFGHMTVEVDGRLCGCGKRGCVEAYASKKGMRYAFQKAILLEQRASVMTELLEGNFDGLRSSILRKGWELKDEVTVEVLTETARYLGVLIGNMITMLAPNVVVLGGGVMDALGKELLPLIKKSTAEHSFPKASYKDTSVELATLGDDAVALGAMEYARARHG